jgi:hypothetical protein
MAQENPSSRADLTDFLVQNVCVDESGDPAPGDPAPGDPAPGDPAACPHARDVKAGEDPPYRLTDYDRANGARYQTITSKPASGDRVLVTKDMGQSGYGYDLIERDGDFVSITRTSDPGCGEQVVSGAGNGDGWILSPTTRPDRPGHVRHAMRLTRAAPPPQCHDSAPVSIVPDRTINAVWHPPELFRFESGKSLLALKTEHHAHFDLSRPDNAIEVIYFTREYGFSRWEAWVPEARCIREGGESICQPGAPDNVLRGRCRPDSARRLRGGQIWVRIDCRDTTFVEPVR